MKYEPASTVNVLGSIFDLKNIETAKKQAVTYFQQFSLKPTYAQAAADFHHLVGDCTDARVAFGDVRHHGVDATLGRQRHAEVLRRHAADQTAQLLHRGARALDVAADLFVEVGLAASKSEARRLAAQGGLSINSRPVTSADEMVTPETGWVLIRGKHSFVELIVR